MLIIKNEHYSANVSIWIDIVNPDGMRKWADDFSKSGEDEADVRAAIGAYVVLIDRGEGSAGWSGVERVLKEVGRVTSIAEGEKWDGVCLGVILGAIAGEDDEGLVEGFEVVDAAAKGKNEFGEAVGVERVREALEANPWAGKKLDDTDVEKLEKELGIGLGEDLEGGFEIGKDEMDEMRKPIFRWDEADEEECVEEMGAIMSKVLALRGEFLFGVLKYADAG